MTSRWMRFSGAFLILIAAPVSVFGQNKLETTSAVPLTVTADYPANCSGILIHGPDWIQLPGESPARSRLKHGIAPAVTYGIAAATMVAEYTGVHSQVKVDSARPIICMCRLTPTPPTPSIVRLHPKKDLRELDGGKLHLGAKLGDADKNDLIPVNVSEPDTFVILVQPQQPLPAGEYALMLGTQNFNIFSFTVSDAGTSPPTPKAN